MQRQSLNSQLQTDHVSEPNRKTFNLIKCQWRVGVQNLPSLSSLPVLKNPNPNPIMPCMPRAGGGGGGVVVCRDEHIYTYCPG